MKFVPNMKAARHFQAVLIIVLASVWLANSVHASVPEIDPGDGAGTTSNPQILELGSCVLKSGECLSNVTALQCTKQEGKFSALTSCKLTFTPNVPIPGLFEQSQPVDESLFGRYVSNFYVFFAGVAGILAVVMMMWGGFHYITAAGNPQRMNEGKEIISNAVIGLVLLLTSYLLLNTVNPRLIQLRVPSLQYIQQVLVADNYCEAQGPEAIAAAELAKAECGTTVTYVKDSQPRECVSLNIPGQLLLPWDEQLACMPREGIGTVTSGGKTSVTTNMVYERRKAAGKDGVCENNIYTADDRCDLTQRILSLQTWLAGACKKANIELGKDICLYKKFLACPTADSERVRCNVGGVNRETVCWDGSQPKQTKIQLFNVVITQCRNPDVVPKPIEEVDSVCCQADLKSGIICSERGGEDEVNVDCSSYNASGAPYRQRCVFVDPRLGSREGCEDIVTRCDLPKKCWAPIDFVTVNRSSFFD
ncbi:MAG: hypothetical protein HY421_01395 [Candidatus Kerfeldbacteria bacterium]|nr:hypothetical protein [Candidatus Kerfeldbacteria bacterium]